MLERLRRHWRRGMSSDPQQDSPVVSQTRADSFGHALAGCAHMLRYQKNTRIMLLATVSAVALAGWLEIDARDWALLILAMGLVWIAEFINAALEAAVNLSMPELHPLARLAKDVAAAAVLLAALVALLVGALILLPPLLNRIA